MSIGSIIGGGFRLIRTQPQVVAIWVVLYAAAISLFTVAMRPMMASIMAAQKQAAANAASGITTPPVFPAAAFTNLLGVELILMVLMLIAFAAVVRAVAWPTGDRFAYLRLGMDELRLLGLGIVLVLLLIVAEIAVVVIIALLVGLSTFILGRGGAGVVGVILAIAIICAAIWAEVRISLAGAFTVIERRIVIRDAWRATKGRFWTLFGAYLLMGLVFMILAIALIAITSPQLLTAYASHDPQAIIAAAQDQYKAQAAGDTIGYIVRMIVGAIVIVPMYIVFFASVATAAVEMGGVTASAAAAFA